MMHSFNLNKEEEVLFQKIVEKDKSKSESAIIRDRLFRRRERYHIKLYVVDMIFLSQLSNMFNSLSDNLQRGNGWEDDLSDLKKLIDEKLNQV